MSEPAVEVGVARTAPRTADVVGLAVASQGAVPRQLGLSRAALSDHGFTGAVGQTLIVPRGDGPTLVAVGIGPSDELDANALRNAAAAFTRAAGKRAHIATNLADVDGVDAASAGQAVAEGVLLASYRYVGLKNDTSIASALRTLTLVASEKRGGAVERGAGRGVTRLVARASIARELANTPPDHLTAREHGRQGRRAGGRDGPRRRGLRQGPAHGDGLRRHPRASTRRAPNHHASCGSRTRRGTRPATSRSSARA